MKQYQFSYENRESLNEKLGEIKNACLRGPFSNVIFYMTWTNSARAQIDPVIETIECFFPDADYYGNEASGNIAMGEMTYGVNITCYVFEYETTKTELVWVEKGTAVATLKDLWRYCRKKEDLRGIELIPSISYLDVLGIDRNVPDIAPDILIFGGASVNYDDATYGADIIAKGHSMTRDGMAVMLYYGRDLHFNATDVLGWKGLGKMMEVTASSGKVIREIDHLPAYSVYEKYLNLTMADKDTLVFPLIAEEDGNKFIRTPQIIQQDKSMMMFANVPEGTMVQISYGDKNTILNSLNDKAIQIAEERPDAIKAYSCAARRLFWGDEDVGRETAVFENIAPVCGFYTGGEILRFGKTLRVLNQTLAIVSFREGGENRNSERIVTAHTEDRSLLSRLTYFVERIVEEERAQRVRAEGFESSFKALYSVMYYIDLTEGRATFLYGDEESKRFTHIFNTRDADTMFDNFYRYYVDAVIEPEDRARVKEVMNAAGMYAALRKSNSVSVNYRVRRNLIDPVYTEMSIIKAAENDGELTAIILAFRLTDAELRRALETQKKMAEDARVIGALTEDFGCVDYVGITEDRVNEESVSVRISKRLKQILPEWERTVSFSDKVKLMSRLVYEPDREAFLEAVRVENIIAELKKSDTCYINTRMVINDEIRYYQVKLSAVRDGGTLSGLVAGTRSVDENTRKELEAQRIIRESLEKAEEEAQRNDLLYDITKAGRWSYGVSADDEILSAGYANRTVRLIDITRVNDPMAWINTLHPDDRERVKGEFLAAVYDHSGNTPYDTTFRIMGRDGHYRWGRSSGRVLRREDGSGEFFGMSMDITQQMEEQQKRLLGAVPLSSDVLTKAKIGMWAFEMDEGQPPRMYGDEAMLGLVGLECQVPPEEMYHAWYDNIDEGSYDLVKDAVNRMINGEHAEVQYPWHYKDGRTIIVRCGGVRNREYTKGIRIEGTHQDVTRTLHFDEEERKREEQQRRDEIARAKAEAADRAKTEFLFNMSHDIRTPMNAIIGFTDKAIKHKNEPKIFEESLEKVKSSSEYLLGIVNDILDMAKIESGKLQICPELHCGGKGGNALIEVFAAEAARKGIAFHTEYDIRDRYFWVDENRANQIVANLISNAIKYTAPGGDIRYTAKQLPCERAGYGTYRVTVEDTGRGMSKEFLARIFDAFERDESAIRSGEQGTGLGMAIVKKLVDAMGATIDIQSEPGKGTRVSFTATHRLATAEEIKTNAQNSGDAGTEAYDFSGKRVLLVEDNALNREIATDILEENGFAVDCADDGTTAVQRMKEAGAEYYDFILMDIQMPVMNGYEATRQIRKMYPDKHIPIIALSANAFEEDKAASIAAGMDDHVAKPIKVKELMKALGRTGNRGQDTGIRE